MRADPVAVATEVVQLTRDGRFADVETLFAPKLRAVVSAETLRVEWQRQLGELGPVAAVGAPAAEPPRAGLVRLSVPVTCQRGGLTVVLSVDDAGQLNGLRLAPAAGSWQPPAYADPGRFTEREVMVGSGPLAVPGTLTLPRGGGRLTSLRGRGRRPGVVLLGSGPHDRDLTTGPNKPFRDLAWGLASRGVAVLRFDKVTHVHGQVAAEPGFTFTDEYLPHALAAVRLLQATRGIDPARVVVVGHSGGGKAAPRVAAADPSIAGVAILAGDAVPLPRAAVRVARYLADLDPAAEAAVELITRQAARVEDPDLSPDTPARDLLFGWPACYWLDLRGYDPVGTAAALDRPVLVLQGGRDYQVTVADDLARWRAGLADHPRATIRVHDRDDHLFFPGTGPSTPADHTAPGHVDPAVVTDLADWLTSGLG